MKVGERTIAAELQEIERATTSYADAVRRGQTASFLQDKRPNVLQMQVAHIMPGDRVDVRLIFSEKLLRTDGSYEFMFPTVVGPRYAGHSVEQWLVNPYIASDNPAAPKISFNVAIESSLRIQKLFSPSHDINPTYESKKSVTFTLPSVDPVKDFIVRYVLSSEEVSAGITTYEGQNEKFFTLTLEPPVRKPGQVRLGKEYIFVVDVSGSMSGIPLDMAKTAMRTLLGGLTPSDKFNVLLFAGSTAKFEESSAEASPQNIQRAETFVGSAPAGGGTDLLPALERAFSLPKADDMSRVLVLISDGYVAVEDQAFELVRKNIGNSNFFSLGIGSSVNRFLIEGLATSGHGESLVITSPEYVKSSTETIRSLIHSPVLVGIQAFFEGFDAYDVEPQAIQDVYLDRPVTLIGKWRGARSGKIRITGKTPAEDFKQVVDASKAFHSEHGSLIGGIWAKERIKNLLLKSNQSSVKGTITELALQYKILSPFTAFVSIDSEVRNAGTFTSITQPLPLLEGGTALALSSGPLMGSSTLNHQNITYND